MNHKLSTVRSARSRKPTLLSIDKNYARRIDTLYRKAFEAPGAIADEATRKRCRLAVMQELDGVCTVFLTHNDTSWPPTREQLKDFQVLLPHDYISVNQANSTLACREPDELSGDDDLSSLRQPIPDHDTELLDLTLDGAQDVSSQPIGHSPLQRSDKPTEQPLESALSPTRARYDNFCGLRDVNIMDPFNVSPSKELSTMESDVPQRSLLKDERPSVRTGHNFSNVAIRAAEREAPRNEPDNVSSIDPSVLRTPKGKILPVIPTASMGSDRSLRSRLSTRQDCSVSSSPRRRRTGVWRTYKSNVGKNDNFGRCD